MTAHRISILINPAGILCGTCDLPIRWVHSELPDGTVGYWEHVDPVALAESMAAHPAGRDL